MRSDPLRMQAGTPDSTAMPKAAGTEAIRLSQVSCGFAGAPEVLKGIDLTIARGEIVTIIGPSGCGKSTLLNVIAGIVSPSEGSVECFGTPVAGLNRQVSYLTQKDTLLPWRNALDNAALPLEIKGVGKRERHAQARAQMTRVGVGDAEKRRPHQLSGGMRSRLSLARALLSDAEIFLMDEPFAAVDALRRVSLQQLLLDLWRETRMTMVYVTHDLNEAITLGHRVLVMRANPGYPVLEREIPSKTGRDVGRFLATESARKLYEELWEALEKHYAS